MNMVLLMTVGLIVFLSLGVPIGFALCIISMIGLIVDLGPQIAWISLEAIPQKMAFGLSNFLLLSIPFFILASKLMNSAGITKRIFNFANAALGYFPGGLAHANIFASLIFSGMSGTAVADVSGLGNIEYKAMMDYGYDEEFSAGITAASALVGPIFPPSVPMVIYALVSGTSVGLLFLAGVIPALLMTTSLMVMAAYIAKKRKYYYAKKPTLKKYFLQLIREFYKVILPLFTPVILLGGIWGGLFTPTEASVIAFCYAFLLSYVVYKETGLKELINVFIETGKQTANIGFLLSASAFFGWVLARSGVTLYLTESLRSISGDPIYVLLIINVFLLVVGCFMEPTTSILVIGSILVPIVRDFGIDLLHFGVIMVLNLMIGLLTPPYGVGLFVMQSISNLSFGRVLRGALPFYIPLLLALLLITVFPNIVLYLPRLIIW